MEHLMELLQKYYLLPMRYIFVILIFLLFIEIKRLILYRQEDKKIIAVLDINNGELRIPITHYEVTIGRSTACDVIINALSISRQHAVLTKQDSGSWKITDTKSKGGTLVNGKPVGEETIIDIGDELTLGGIKVVLTPATFIDANKYEKSLQVKERKFLSKIKQKINFIGKKEGNYNRVIRILNVFQILACIQLYVTIEETYRILLLIVFGVLIILPWLFKIISKFLKIQNLGAEGAAFFLTTMGFCVVASASPADLIKQLIAFILGIIFYSVVCIMLQNVNQVMKIRRYAAVLSIVILIINFIFGSNINGQTNWIRLGSLTLQPSEIVKVFFIFASSATLDWLFSTKNLRNLIGYSVTCVALLFLMGDFGTALIFFFTFIILMFMTTGDIKAVFMTCIVAGLGGLLVLNFKPYIMQRFATWRNVWAYIYEGGSQQARALIGIASGGLLGLGAGTGLARTLYAGDSDIVISMICEEWGLIIAVFVSSIYVIFMISAIRSHKVAYSSYYVVAASATAALFIIQASLNIFGAIDVLPFTGVTLPFISNGGSSMMGSWGLLAFITAALNYARPKNRKVSESTKNKEVTV